METIAVLVGPAAALLGVAVGAALEHWRQKRTRTREGRMSAYRRFLSLYRQLPTQTLLAASEVAQGSPRSGALESEQLVRSWFLSSAVDRVKQINELQRESAEGLAELELVGSPAVLEKARAVNAALLALSLEIPKAQLTAQFDAPKAGKLSTQHAVAVQSFTTAARKDLL